jgi:hypothetical protein
MNKISLKSLIENGTIVSFSKLRQNSSEYHYITFLSKVGEETSSQNIYFSKNSNEIVKNYKLGDDITNLLITSEIVSTTNEAGEVRYKLSLVDDTKEYINSSTLLSIFGIKEDTKDFDLTHFKTQFSAKPAPVVANVGG